VIGRRFGRLLVKIRLPSDKVACVSSSRLYRYRGRYECRCDCGKIVSKRTDDLLSGNTRSCGCLQLENQRRAKIKDLIGARFGRLLVLGRDVSKGCPVYWNCRCDCGREKSIAATNLRGGTRSCGCLFLESCRSRSGPNHSLWRHDLSMEDRNKYYRRGYKNNHEFYGWSRNVFARDNFTCQVCHSRGGKLSGHHLNGWNWSVEDRFNLDNGVTLCIDCHTLFHRAFGKGDNTKDQFLNFVENVYINSTEAAYPLLKDKGKI
jgi:hypothetical protein